MCLIHVYAGMVKPSWTFVTANLFENQSNLFFSKFKVFGKFSQRYEFKIYLPSGGFKVGGGPSQDEKGGPFDAVIMLSQP